MAQFDIKRIAASSIVHKYRGAIGSIRSIDTHPTLPLIASVSIDQYLRIHSAETYRQISKVTRFLFLKIESICIYFFLVLFKISFDICIVFSTYDSKS